MGYHWWATVPTAALPAQPGPVGGRAAAAAAPASQAAPSSSRRPAAAAAAPSASGFLLGGASVLLSLSGITSFLHLHRETEAENTHGLEYKAR